VVFIENSTYKDFPNLAGPARDYNLMYEAFSRYKIHKIIHKQNLTKKELERFFAIELRDLTRLNHVNSILIWFAGHGKFLNQTGYWIPVDATYDEEFDYYNINALKASLYSYTDMKHILVITDACEAGPSFNLASRGLQNLTCNNWELTDKRSSQIFSSASNELATDNSLFARSFANALLNNPDDCIPIESVVQRVTLIIRKQINQKPIFGKISGLKDENGTFFFISR
jgi:hypothetical protein